MASENILEVMDTLVQVVSDLKLIVYGDEKARINGLLVDFGELRRDVAIVKEEVHKLKNRRPQVWLWILGYFSFLAGTMFGVVAILNQIDNHNVFDLPAPVAVFLASMFVVAALFLFLGGFGWFNGRE
jgi:hypothetical protein